MAHTQALYYPWIDIRDDAWLKTSALFWDMIQTIVPASIERPYKGKTAREFKDEGVLIPLRVDSEMEEIEGLSDDVVRYLSSDEAANILLSTEKRKRAYLHPQKLPRSIRHMSRLHPEKMAYEVRHMMRALGLGKQEGEWMRVDREFASFYMTLLATRLSDRLGIGLLTDSPASHRLSSKARADSEISSVYRGGFHEYEFRGRGPRRTAPRELAEGMMIDLIVEQIGIDPQTPAQSILQFRNSHRDEIGKFRTKIEELTGDIPNEPTVDALRQYVADRYQNEVAPAISDLKKALTSSRIGWITRSWMKVSFLSAGTSSALVGIGLAAPNALLIGAGVSLIGMGILYNEHKKKALRENPYSYVVSIQKDLA